jgi:acid phosphatase type 7
MPIYRPDPVNENYTKIIPVIFGTGNHDLGVSAYSNIPVVHNEYQPVYKHYFPQNTKDSTVPDISHRRSYFSHRFSDKLLILSLDVGYQYTIEGEQTNWLNSELEASEYKIKLVQYHSPIYPACSPNRDTKVQELGKKYWVPLFEEFNVTLVSENHNHIFKRSKPIKQGKIDPNGITYIGEGSWGAVRNY